MLRSRSDLWRILTLLLVLAIGVSGVITADAATPASDTLSPTNPKVTYTAGPFLVSNPSGFVGDVQCTVATPCDDFALTVSAPADYASKYNVQVRIEWPNTASDMDVYILDSKGNLVTQAASSSDPEIAVFPAVAGNYTVRVVPFAATGDSITGTITFTDKPSAAAPGAETAPTYTNYTAPEDLYRAHDAGEPSIGVNWNTGAVMYQSYNATYRVNFNDSVSPATATWANKTANLYNPNLEGKCTAQTSLDPILYTDSKTGRTFESQLIVNPVLNSLTCYTDDDGESWHISEGGGINSGVDHQTVGGGAFSKNDPTGPLTAYPDIVYYCSQDIADALCSTSRDGGVTFSPAVPVYNLTQCGGLHGHVKVAPDGTAYVPNASCGGQQAVVVSTDGGLNWSIRKVPYSTPSDSDPSVGIASDGTVYFGYAGADGHAYVTSSRDQGRTWGKTSDVGAALGIENIVFPAVVAGDPDRAAFTFIGTKTSGNFQAADFPGEWHLYVAHTYDGGQTWTTTDATPTDPVQRGCVWLNGGSNPCRNLLDFMDAQVDKEGRVLVGYADGCTVKNPAPADPMYDVDCVHSGKPNYDSLAAIARQSSGKGVFSAYDKVADLTPTDVSAAQTRPHTVALTATVKNAGGADASGVVVRFLDGSTVLGSTTVDVAAGSTAKTAISWDTKGANGDHKITVAVDPANAIAESNENNNSLTRTITVKGNKVQNGSFEQSSGGSPTAWSGSSGTSYGATGASDGSYAASASGTGGAASLLNPAWTSAPIDVTPGETYNLAMTVNTSNLSSAPGLKVTYLDAVGNVLSQVSGITTDLTGTGTQQVFGRVTVPAGVSQVKLTLSGFSATDLSTSGTVSFDDVWMWQP